MKEQAEQKTFLRKAQPKLEFNPMSIKEGQTKFIEVISDKVGELFIKAKGENVPCINVTDLETGVTHTLWLSGKLLTTARMLQITSSLKGKKLEVANLGLESVDVDGITYDMNKYEVYELQ